MDILFSSVSHFNLLRLCLLYRPKEPAMKKYVVTSRNQEMVDAYKRRRQDREDLRLYRRQLREKKIKEAKDKYDRVVGASQNVCPASGKIPWES